MTGKCLHLRERSEGETTNGGRRAQRRREGEGAGGEAASAVGGPS